MASRALLGDDEILCDADYDSDSTDLVDEDLNGVDLDGDLGNAPGEYRHVPWHGDPLHTLRNVELAPDEELARDEEVWQQPVIHHDSPPAVSLPRVQSQHELDRMHHLGAAYFGAEDQPLQFKLKSAFGSLSTPEMGEKETDVTRAPKPLGRSRSSSVF